MIDFLSQRPIGRTGISVTPLGLGGAPFGNMYTAMAAGEAEAGILASGAVEGATYNYRPATPKTLERVRRIEAVCTRYGVPLQAAALQFPMNHPQVTSVIPGARSISELEQSVRLSSIAIPVDFWRELKAQQLIDERAPVGQA
ncbi:Pyridoxal 4-dehydrogenase [Variovorax sp. PBS-H4]|uniref:aldo/keto reductase n=1 Tax=Variovorax sp. PBS-H4 TaxID=434008 RepID=UPI0013182E81|nr:aldo/keto reductase [Variovorax sp. PBS-H4]VTU34253.1 Pyridoxal 4-dehydrogenase [Variovorax sp. PBS-H4]